MPAFTHGSSFSPPGAPDAPGGADHPLANLDWQRTLVGDHVGECSGTARQTKKLMESMSLRDRAFKLH
jgi:hypothetical protein